MLFLRETQIKTIIRYHLTPVRMAIIIKSTNKKHWRGCGEKGPPSHTVGGIVNWCSHSGEQYGGFSKELKIELLYDPAIPLLDIYTDKF